MSIEASRRTPTWPIASRRQRHRGSPGHPRSGLRRASSRRSVIHPSPIAPVMVSASAGFASSSHRRGVTPLVLLLKRSGNSSAEIPHRGRAQERGVNGRHAIRAVRSNDGQIGHADPLYRALLDQTRARDASLVAREAAAHVIEQPAIDLEDDLAGAGAATSRTTRAAISRAPPAAACGSCRRASAARGPTLDPIRDAPRRAGSAAARGRPAPGVCR